jgi:hypothetical protein
MHMKPVLIAGGMKDLNLAALFTAAKCMRIPVVDVRHDVGSAKAFEWDLDRESVLFSIDGNSEDVGAAFIRFDVFSGMMDAKPAVAHRANGWFHAIYGWLLADPRIRLLNRDMQAAAHSKAAVLRRAKACGLAVPPTLITNLRTTLENRPDSIVKPAGGGDYCYDLSTLVQDAAFRDGVASVPAIVQKKLIAPEVRIYVIGSDVFAFEMKTSSLDYRVKQDVEVVPLAQIPIEAIPLQNLMSELKMNFGAADFKTNPANGKLFFLELNTSPMFARFDEVTGGKIGRSIMRSLTAAN